MDLGLVERLSLLKFDIPQLWRVTAQADDGSLIASEEDDRRSIVGLKPISELGPQSNALVIHL